ncbi:homocitrate synthase/isopropylmalate synthase family protein [Stetteria hydrogenophila]
MNTGGRGVDGEARRYEELFPFTDVPRIPLDTGAPHLGGIYLTDSTLREGQQGWRPLTVEEGVRVYELLAELNGGGDAIRATEVFLYTSKDRELARRLLSYGYEYPKVIGWIRARREDLRLVREAGLDETVILTSISDYQIYDKLGLTRREAMEKYLSVVEEALRSGVSVKCALEDVTRADLHGMVIPFVRRLLRLGERYGVRVGVKLSDTLGLALPFPEVPPPRGLPALVRELRRHTGLPCDALEFHGHNDFGLAVANHLAAWVYGACGSNCTLLGLGERSGNCPLEVMLIHYAGIKGSRGVNLKAIARVAEFFESIGYRVPPFQPVVGENAFKTKSGIHIDGLLKNPRIYLPLDPVSVLGMPYSVVVDQYSGRSAIVYWLKHRLGVEVGKDHPAVEAIYRAVVEEFNRGRREPLSDEDLARLARRYLPHLLEEALGDPGRAA